MLIMKLRWKGLKVQRSSKQAVVQFNDRETYYKALRWLSRKRMLAVQTVNPFSPTTFVAWITIMRIGDYAKADPATLPSASQLIASICPKKKKPLWRREANEIIPD